MNPRKVRNILPVLAVERKEDLALLQKLNQFHWDKVRETLSSTPSLRVTIYNLGEFRIKHWLLEGFRNRYEKMFCRAKEQNKIYAGEAERRLEHIKELILSYNTELTRKDLFKQRRDEYFKNLEEQKSDSGRNQKLDLHPQ